MQNTSAGNAVCRWEKVVTCYT